MAEAKPNKYEVLMRTENPVHVGEFKWAIENVSKFTRKLISPKFSLETGCKPEFQLVSKFNERYPDVHVTNVNVGLQRIDSGEETIRVTVDVQLLSKNGDSYCRKETSFTCKANGAPFYIFSELFSDSASKLTLPVIPNRFSSEGNHELLGLTLKSLVASHGNVGRIFILPSDELVIKGHMKIFGCCAVSNRMSLPYAQERLPLQTHVNNLLTDFKHAYENGTSTDVELMVGNQTIKAHKFVLQARSPVFRGMFENNSKEKEDNIIQVKDIDFPVLEALVWYMYTGIVQKLPYVDVYDLYEAADKYDVCLLQQACSEILKSFIDDDTVCRILMLSDLHSDAFLKENAMQYITRNFSKVKITQEWMITVNEHQRIASDVLERLADVVK